MGRHGIPSLSLPILGGGCIDPLVLDRHSALLWSLWPCPLSLRPSFRHREVPAERDAPHHFLDRRRSSSSRYPLRSISVGHAQPWGSLVIHSEHHQCPASFASVVLSGRAGLGLVQVARVTATIHGWADDGVREAENTCSAQCLCFRDSLVEIDPHQNSDINRCWHPVTSRPFRRLESWIEPPSPLPPAGDDGG